MQATPDDSSNQPTENWKQLKREWDKKKHLFNEQEMEIYNSLDDLVPMSQVLKEIDEMNRNDQDSE